LQAEQPVVGNGMVRTLPQQQIRTQKIEELMETAFSLFVPPALLSHQPNSQSVVVEQGKKRNSVA
jgi:hypothetical protein